MQINLSEETISIVCCALSGLKNVLECRLREVKIGKAAKEKENDFKEQLEEVNAVLSIFEDLIK